VPVIAHRIGQRVPRQRPPLGGEHGPGYPRRRDQVAVAYAAVGVDRR
jgi:hypothetical protein